MDNFFFVIYGILHAGDEIEAKSFLQKTVKDCQFEHLNIVVEKDKTHDV